MLSLRISRLRLTSVTGGASRSRNDSLYLSQGSKPLPGILRNYSRLSNIWLPTGNKNAPPKEDSFQRLIRAGFLDQSHAGIFQMLPLGQRVQEKLERLIDKYMLQLRASKVSLSTISSQELWKRTGRLDGYGQELFRLTDRKDYPFLLAPTHEEEITNLVSKRVHSYKDLPLRLYQIGRKYRDERRPRQGLLRSREFVMKDLYTFDWSQSAAQSIYDEVRAAYSSLFEELRLPCLVAEANSGDIGGDLSHEYHLPTSIGEDHVISCSNCDYVANEEIAVSHPKPVEAEDQSRPLLVRGISKNRRTLVNIWFPGMFSPQDINYHTIKGIFPDFDSSVNNAVLSWQEQLMPSARLHQEGEEEESKPQLRLLNFVDHRLGDEFVKTLRGNPSLLTPHASIDLSGLPIANVTSLEDGSPLNVIRVQDGDGCPRCGPGKLKVQKAIELGHTFHLGTRYSVDLRATVGVPGRLLSQDLLGAGGSDAREGSSGPPDKTAAVDVDDDKLVVRPLQMGCHGIGVSRIIAAVAHYFGQGQGASSRSLRWPRAIAPFEVVVIPGPGMGGPAAAVAAELELAAQAQPAEEPAAQQQQQQQILDVALDDREKDLRWKLVDADLIGIPVRVVVGRAWASDQLCEVVCGHLDGASETKLVRLADLRRTVDELLSRF
ncbi:prolyl-tRNA synthetase [Xylariaceae sp. FL0804]|nr:prolyl-tRNA synthetase [Xylariaceae sp. FL0804]